MSHTRGPWYRNIPADGKYPTVFAGRKSQNQHVAVALQQKSSAETEANIGLIAAAPELLAALLRAQNILVAHCTELDCDGAIEQIDAAIAKATKS